tara:strand:+ start:2218 stop:4077 length:1860 start_codon:yes stop_codon:yes gene_type:complete
MKNVICTLFFLLPIISIAKENKNTNASSVLVSKQLISNCAEGTAQTILDINNVSTTILNGGDMWWDLSSGSYEVPKGSNLHSIFAGALWIGGVDDDNQVKVAAQTYRQSGNDYWPGPLENVRLNSNGDQNSAYGSTDAATCSNYNKHYVLLKEDVIDFVEFTNSAQPEVDFPNYEIPQSILEYPGNRTSDDFSNAFNGFDNVVETNPYYALESLAPYRDVNNDNYYNPNDGDYPEYNLDGSLDCMQEDVLFGDQTLWWVFNDNGNSHNASGSIESIGLEIQAQAFAFATNSHINNMTFYNYKLINRSHNALNDTYFGVWVDPDLGNSSDDYVGCDVGRGLGYCYNGDAEDEGETGYGVKLPAVGVDFFRGPIADENDGIDNDLDGEVDEVDEQIIMSKFVYYNNDGSVSGNPITPNDFYNYLKGIWLDNTPMTYGGDGRNPSNPLCNYMFPGNTDPSFNDEWTEQTANNIPGDRRFIQSAGPFTLQPGAVNQITSGVVWARESSNDPFNAVDLLFQTDDLAQELFESCFYIDSETSMKENELIEFKLYPNPAIEFIRIEVTSEINSIRVLDLLGKVYDVKVSSNGFGMASVDISSLSQGNYLCVLTTEGVSTTKAFVKN